MHASHNLEPYLFRNQSERKTVGGVGRLQHHLDATNLKISSVTAISKGDDEMQDSSLYSKTCSLVLWLCRMKIEQANGTI